MTPHDSPSPNSYSMRFWFVLEEEQRIGKSEEIGFFWEEGEFESDDNVKFIFESF